MIRKRISASLGIAAAVVGVAGTSVLPVASADTLSNGLTVDCKPDSDVHTTCIIGGCPRVDGDYVVDAVHVMVNGGEQQEYDFKCINGQTARQGVGDTGGGPFTVGVQACRKVAVGSDKCTPYANYTYNPPPKPAAPPPQAPPPAQQAPPVQCPSDSPVKTVPAGQTCPAAAPVTDAISLSFSPPGLGSITATISNSSNLNGQCTYDATPFNTHRDFNVPAHGSQTLNFSGFNTGTNYHVTVSCKDASGKQTQPIGTASQDVRF